MNSLDLDVWRRLRRLGLRLTLGPRAGTNPRLRGLLRFLALRGDQAGQRTEGRLRDYLFVLSALKDSTLYRRREIMPLRRLHMVVDIRDFLAGPSRRLLRGAELIGGVLLAMQGTRVSLSAWGARDAYPVQLFSGDAQWPWFCKVVAGMANLPIERWAPTGALQRAAVADEPAHVVLVTSWIEPPHIIGLQTPLGGSCFLVEPASSRFGPRVGTADPLLSVQPASAADDRDADQYRALAHVCEQRRFDLHRLDGSGDLVDSLERALGDRAA
jgi:hypothetical protein